MCAYVVVKCNINICETWDKTIHGLALTIHFFYVRKQDKLVLETGKRTWTCVILFSITGTKKKIFFLLPAVSYDFTFSKFGQQPFPPTKAFEKIRASRRAVYL